MSETNGSGRLDRIERAIERMAQLAGIEYDYVRNELRILLRAQIVMQDQMDKQRAENKERQTYFDERVDKPVAAIGALVAQRANPL